MDSYWSQFRQKEHIFEKLEQNIQVDVCVIGAGLTGLTTAYYLLKQGKTVAILEKKQYCSHTSAGTTGKVTSQHGLFYDYLMQSQGKEFAKAYFDANQSAIANIENIIQEEKIDCDFRKLAAYVFTQNEQEVSKIRAEVKATKKLGIPSRFVENIALPLKVQGGILFENQAQFHPVKYANGLVDSIIKNKGVIYENTKVTDVQSDEVGYTVMAENYQVKADKVVVATRYPFITIPGYYFIKMYQSTSFAILVDTHTDLSIEGVYINAEQPQLSFRVIEENEKKYLLVVGYDYKTGEEFLGDGYEYLKKKVETMYPNAEVIHKWCAEDCISLDKIPYIGDFSKSMPGVYVATGYNKWGMTSSNVAANIITDEIMGKENPYKDIFRSDRLEPIKNKDEMKNMIKESVKSLVGKRLEGKDTPTCTHLGCKTSWNAIEQTWDCPCHGSRYDKHGVVIEGPAVEDLKKD